MCTWTRPEASAKRTRGETEEGEICACGREEGKISCVHEHARKTDEELNEPTRGPNLANFLKTHLRPVFLLSERPLLKRWRFYCVIEAGFHNQSRWSSTRPRNPPQTFSQRKCGVSLEILSPYRIHLWYLSPKWNGFKLPMKIGSTMTLST